MTKKHHWGALYGTVLVLFAVFVLLDSFVIPRTYAEVGDNPRQSSDRSSASGAAVTDTSYDDGRITILLTTTRYCDTTVYTADITLSSAGALKTALAENSYGKNVMDTTSSIAEDHSAILAVNGDDYGAQNSGYVIRNGTLLRDTAASADQADLVIGSDGSFSIVKEGDVTAQELLEGGASQVLSFGPGLVENGTISVAAHAEVDQAMASNPRTAIGEIAPLHYVMVVADGRTQASEGLSLYELAEFIQGLGATTAYNLDGGGSSTLYFNGKVVNHPTTNGKAFSERKVSDIVYLGA
jgi:exopolysaccharide biosynthesis protein